jgi:hypothetical protein
MVKYSRFVRKTSNGDPIKWIEVLSLDQLPLQREFDNFIDPSVYHSQPEIEETCNKDLRTPLSTIHSFMKIVCTSIVPNTSEYLRALNKKRTCYEEIVEFVMAAMAVVICSGKFQHFKSSVGTLRQFLKSEHGISAKWSGVNRLQELRTCMRSYGEHENEQSPGLMARKVENVVNDVYNASKNTIKVHGAYSMDESLVPYHGRNGIHHKIPRKVS